MKRKAMLILIITLLSLALFIVFVQHKYTPIFSNIFASNLELNQQKSLPEGFLHIIDKQFPVDNPLIQKIRKSIAQSPLSEKISKGRIGVISNHLQVGCLVGKNKLKINQNSPYVKAINKLTIGEPYAEQVALITKNNILYPDEINKIEQQLFGYGYYNKGNDSHHI